MPALAAAFAGSRASTSLNASTAPPLSPEAIRACPEARPEAMALTRSSGVAGSTRVGAGAGAFAWGPGLVDRAGWLAGAAGWGGVTLGADRPKRCGRASAAPAKTKAPIPPRFKNLEPGNRNPGPFARDVRL